MSEKLTDAAIDTLAHGLLEALIEREGGYVYHPADKGGPTRFGITQDVARAQGYHGDMRDLPRELDWIVGRACAFRAEERYPGVDALSDDIHAILQNRPPRARATGPVYRVAKFVRRNWVAVSAGTVVA